MANLDVVLNAGPIDLLDVSNVARGWAKVSLGPGARRAIARSRKRLESVLDDGEPHYGVNTGFGSFSRQRISQADLAALQRNLVRSHAAGIGAALPGEIVRGMMLCLAGSLSRGLSGVRVEVVESLVRMLNAGVTPVVPETGSVGASGDLAPLAHVALVLIGEGEARMDGRVMSGAAAMKRAGIRPVTLGAKEGLALINGTHLMAAQAALFCVDFYWVFEAALVAAAMSIDACRGTDAFLDARLHEARRAEGQIEVARRLRELIRGSKIIPSHQLNDPRVQDPYSLRCAPQVLGAALEVYWDVLARVQRELGAVTDNPLVFEGKKGAAEIISGGNFHGMPMAVAMDMAAIACSHVAGIAERRVYHMLSGFDPETGLPPYLSPSPGLHSGLMIAQYTAAACCNEIIGLCMPASVANISTSAGMEDYNSFGPRSAAKARRALDLTRSVVAIELLCASQALEHHRPLKSGKGVEFAHARIRERVRKLTADRPPAPDVAAIDEMISTGRLVA